ncbi:PREDICTED: probable BOI-related E3 ubiquitin-protein ligase 2 [Nicotiana attenuata]|uniref:Boi-related e3 ubiquitin-protein ligase 2 n=1 Tax=Nicotiana attenuata TaxID=49451 RepID=A0A314KN12_NICAT|nr:PREDICTED: probable BOI-related E3 ubiquitin-protein ligase 2 [Nicotiana attenuata]OIT30690.1 putative boi-related e3 ubiquitin-protein ligase 2 [Nicotiana attenuata]
MTIQAQLYSDNLGFPLVSSQDLMENNVCGFSHFYFNPQHQQQQQQFLQIQQQQQQFQILNQKNNQNLMNFSTTGHNTNSNQTVVSLACQLEKQRLEIDQFINLQNERLRLALQEQRKQQLTLILRNYETKAQFLLKQKDEEIAKAMNKSKELQDFLKRIEMENQTWQRIAKENEAIVLSLNNTIEQLRGSACVVSTNGGVGDAESCCDVQPMEYNVQETQQLSLETGNEEQDTRKMMCKSCNCRKSCIVFLPCRHLCSCKDCDPFLHSCPVCRIEKKASIEALI